MPSRFGSLIVKPLQEIGKQEKRVQPKVIFTDGLDKCADGDAHAEIIKINAPSIREGSTPFHWAISSRTEPYIIPISKQNSIAPVTCNRTPYLLSGRQRDRDVPSGRKNILEEQDFPQFLSSWPTDNNIRTLVKAVAGLFAHPAAALHHVPCP